MSISKKASKKKFNSYLVNGVRFDITNDYELDKPIGQGAYGFVCSAYKGDEKVAIKKVGNVFDHPTDTKRTLRELKIMKHLGQHENILAIKEIMEPKNKDSFKDIYIVSELMDTDLHQIIISPQELTDDHNQYFLYQLLRGLKYLHSAHVMHRDLKPSNLLVNGNCDLKVCDFGLARVANPEENYDGFMTEYVATRWYRAPEIMLSWRQYTKSMDMWSVGCIFAELLGRKPLFPGKDYLEQIDLITDILGSPSEEDIEQITNEKARRYMRSLDQKDGVPFEELYPDASELAIDLLYKMLTFNPEKRITVEEALAHPYLEALHDEDDEPECSVAFDFSWEKGELTKPILRDLLFGEMLVYHPELRDKRKKSSSNSGSSSSRE